MHGRAATELDRFPRLRSAEDAPPRRRAEPLHVGVTPSRKSRMADARPPFPPFTRETAMQKIRAAEDGWNSCNPERVSLAYTAGQPLAEPRPVPDRPGRDRRLPHPQMGQGAGLPADQGAVGLHRRPHRRPLRLRAARRLGPVVALLRQRELALRRKRPDGRAPRQHQRPWPSARMDAPVPLGPLDPAPGAIIRGSARPGALIEPAGRSRVLGG